MRNNFFFLGMALLCVLYLVVPVVTGYVIVLPLHKRALTNKDVIRRFTMFDFLALAVQLQVYLAVCVALSRDLDVMALLPSAGLVFAGVVAMWWAGVEAAARAGVADTARRAAIHLVLLPGTATLMVLSGVSLFAIGDALFWLSGGRSVWADAAGGGLLTTLTVGGTLVGILLLRWLAAWIARPSGAPPIVY